MDILAFCRKRRIATDGFRIKQTVDWHTKQTDQSKVLLNVELPTDFPEKYEKTIQKAVDSCLVARLGRGLNENSFASSVSRSNEK
jgi:ribosomal protein S12 methylthiotransferase accessory factor